MRILLHDFGCYAFILPLARWLADQGHQVLHLSAKELVGPRGTPVQRKGDPPGLTFDTVRLGRPFTRYSLPRRLLDEYRYGRGLVGKILEFQPDLVVSANTPPLAQAVAFRAARRRAIPCVGWVQDIFSLGAAPMMEKLPKPIATLALAALRRLEFGTLSQAAGLIVIAPSFLASLKDHGVQHPMTLVQENWAASSPDTVERHKAWAEAQGLGGAKIILAAGTLGRKHDPDLLAQLATGLATLPDVRLIVVSEGPGRDYLEKLKAVTALPNLSLLDYQPSAQVPAMLASADIGLVQLNALANGMSIPSKVYSYAAAGLPILAAIPQSNHAAGLIRDYGLGCVVEPDDPHGFVAAARRLLEDAPLRQACGAAGLAFTAQHGNIAVIGGRIMAFLEEVRGRTLQDP
jgi:glycosyltransferase involved in cell wall biosynthesis